MMSVFPALGHGHSRTPVGVIPCWICLLRARVAALTLVTGKTRESVVLKISHHRGVSKCCEQDGTAWN